MSSEDTPTSPTASEHPLEEPDETKEEVPPQVDFLTQNQRDFANAVGVMLDEKLRPVNRHIEEEDRDRGELLRILVGLKTELGLVAAELKAGRLDAIALHAAIDILRNRVDKQEERIGGLEDVVGELERKS